MTITITEEDKERVRKLSEEKRQLDLQDWETTLRREGREEGIREGILKGMQKGIKKGREEEKQKIIEMLKISELTDEIEFSVKREAARIMRRIYEKELDLWTASVALRREGRKEGIKQGIQKGLPQGMLIGREEEKIKIINLLESGKSPKEILKDYENNKT